MNTGESKKEKKNEEERLTLTELAVEREPSKRRSQQPKHEHPGMNVTEATRGICQGRCQILQRSREVRPAELRGPRDLVHDWCFRDALEEETRGAGSREAEPKAGLE